jgi:hypothetical protein
MSEKCESVLTNFSTENFLRSGGFHKRPVRILIIKLMVPVVLILIAVVLVLAGVAIITQQARLTTIGEAIRTAGALITALAFALGVWQWLAARHELSFDKYYERLNIANGKFDAARISALKNPPDTLEVQSHTYTMFVFSEIDNLEYILDKYCLGYVDIPLVRRAIAHFKGRCLEGAFRKAALHCIGTDNGKPLAGYSDGTREIVKRLAQ